MRSLYLYVFTVLQFFMRLNYLMFAITKEKICVFMKLVTREEHTLH